MVKIDYVKKMQKMVKKRIQDGVYAKIRANQGRLRLGVQIRKKDGWQGVWEEVRQKIQNKRGVYYLEPENSGFTAWHSNNNFKNSWNTHKKHL